MTRDKGFQYFDIQNIKDVDLLIEYIKSHGNFTQKHFNILLRACVNSSQPQRIRKKLIHQVKPLISKDIFESNNEETEIDCMQSEPQDFFMRAHKASEFTMKDGYIQIGQYILKSKRIKNVHPSWLKDINHEFYIVRDYLFKNRFYFNPPTDLSYMLNAISNQMEKQKKDTKRKQFYKQLQKNIEEYFYSYIDISHLNDSHIIPYEQKKLAELLQIDSPEYYYGNRRPNDFLFIPMEDVNVKDGIIEIKLKNMDVISPGKGDEDSSNYHYLSREKFVDYVRFYLPEEEFIKEFEENIKQYYDRGIKHILNRIKERPHINLNTFITSKSFQTIFKGRKFLTFSCDKNFFVYWSLFNYIDYHKFTQGVIAEKIVLKKDTKLLLESLRNKYQSILRKDDCELAYKELEIKKCLDEKSSHSSLYKAKEFFYFKKLNHRISFCDEKKHHVLFFYENMHHCSDDWTHYSPGHTTYIVWSKHIKNVIELYPTNKGLSNYKFYINTEVINQRNAAFLLYLFFTSNIKNKRQGFSINYSLFLKEVGIVQFSRF